MLLVWYGIWWYLWSPGQRGLLGTLDVCNWHFGYWLTTDFWLRGSTGKKRFCVSPTGRTLWLMYSHSHKSRLTSFQPQLSDKSRPKPPLLQLGSSERAIEHAHMRTALKTPLSSRNVTGNVSPLLS